MLQGSWHFPSNENGIYNGINDSGIATFTTDDTGHINSLVREIIQNSLDAVKDDDEPVVVEFRQFELAGNSFPGSARFRAVLQQCLSENYDEKDTARFFRGAMTCFKGPLNVLRISDFNTKGLEGADTGDYKSSWGRLVKCNGASNQNSTAGGSYGIGKSASFLCSDLRTVFYSSLDEHGIASTIGVSRLISFKDPENEHKMTTGQGFFAKSKRIDAILSLPPFEQDYVRSQSGTDIYIMGMSDVDDLKGKLVEAVLDNFLVSIWANKLRVVIDDTAEPIRLCRESLGKYVGLITNRTKKSASRKKADEALNNYYELLTSPPDDAGDIRKISLESHEFGEKYGFGDGEATLFLMKKKDADRRILMTRASGMKLFLQNHLPRSVEFTGILYITGDKMNEEFRKMETPAHDKWTETSLACRGNERRYRAMKHDLFSYIKGKILSSFGSQVQNEIDAFGASDFLPDVDARPSDSGHEVSFLPHTAMGTLAEMTGVHLPRQTEELERGGGEDDDIQIGPRGKNKHKKHGNGQNTNSGNKSLTFKNVALPGLRCFCRNESEGIFRLALRIPHTVRHARIRLDISGEQSAFAVPVKEAEVVKGKAAITAIEQNCIELTHLKLNDVVILDVGLAFNHFCLLEVSYSEAK
ncbi:hypothetical protein [Megasphaera sp.]|uniref:hypothetical protein n=1 Tax=Megasphaera TaxID=906 RepID=UPI00257B7F3A|nr:hypothetical protein [Megasphaera sp.]